MNRGNAIFRSFVGEGGLNAELIPGIPIMELCDQRRLLVENHQGIVGYSCNEIQIKVRFGRICVCGENLKLKQMCRNKLVITGKICTVNLQGRG